MLLVDERRQVYERAPQHVDLLLLGSSGAALYNAPRRLAAPYLASLGAAAPAGGYWSEAAMLDLAACSGAPSGGPLSSQVPPAALHLLQPPCDACSRALQSFLGMRVLGSPALGAAMLRLTL